MDDRYHSEYGDLVGNDHDPTQHHQIQPGNGDEGELELGVNIISNGYEIEEIEDEEQQEGNQELANNPGTIRQNLFPQSRDLSMTNHDIPNYPILNNELSQNQNIMSTQNPFEFSQFDDLQYFPNALDGLENYMPTSSPVRLEDQVVPRH